MNVILLQHICVSADGLEDVKIIGVYSSLDYAHFAIATLSSITGFSKEPDGFIIDEYTLDKNHWSEGFIDTKHV